MTSPRLKELPTGSFRGKSRRGGGGHKTTRAPWKACVHVATGGVTKKTRGLASWDTGPSAWLRGVFGVWLGSVWLDGLQQNQKTQGVLVA